MSGIVNSLGSRSGVIGRTELDYEEGIHVPTLVCGDGSFTTSTAQTLSYIKIGGICHVNGYINVSSESGSLNATLQMSLPFTSKTGLSEDSEAAAGSIGIRSHGGTHTTGFTPWIGAGTNLMSIISVDESGTSVWVDQSHLDTAFTFIFQLTYPIN